MSKNNELSLVDGNTIEIHYWFVDDTHSMDALVQNKCEYEFLGILKEVASTFKVHITVETEPLAEGGLRRWFSIATKDENKKATITIAIITALTTGAIVTPITTSIGKITEKLIENIFEDPEIKELEKEKLRLEIKKLRQETGTNIHLVDSSNVVKRKKSNFYETLEKYPKVDRVSFLISDEDKNEILEEKTVYSKNFKDFVLTSDDLEPIEVDNAVIEIISPVLKKGNYKWMGIYNGEPVPFSMKSQEFKNLVQTGEVKFRNGTSINCFLTIKRKIDNEGKEKITGIEVNRVNHFFENEKPIETPEGKKHRQKKEEEKNQLELFARKRNVE
jgi:hypothetical protein